MDLNNDIAVVARNGLSVSVIIPTLNEQAFVASAIQSAQDAGADEIIVVDGQSVDDSFNIAASMGCRVVMSQPGRGLQLDLGARTAKGDILVFLHADARLADESLVQLRSRLCESPHLPDMWGCFRQRIDAGQKIYRWIEWGNEWRARVRRMVFGDQCFWLYKKTYELSGGFPHQPLMEDVALSYRLRQFGRPAILPGPLTISSRRWQRRGVFRQTIRNWTLFGFYRVGVSPSLIARWYR